jgi:hypothetical protein
MPIVYYYTPFLRRISLIPASYRVRITLDRHKSRPNNFTADFRAINLIEISLAVSEMKHARQDRKGPARHPFHAIPSKERITCVATYFWKKKLHSNVMF